MSELDAILKMCDAQQVTLAENDGQIEVLFDEAPSDELVSLLRSHKAQLVEAFQQGKLASASDLPLKAGNHRSGPLSFGQKRLHFLDALGAGSTQFNMPMTLALRGEVNRENIEEALRSIVERHQVLRTVYDTEGFQQRVLKAWRFELAEHVMAVADSGPVDITPFIEEEHLKPFDLESDLMLRARLLVVQADYSVLMVTVHHIACDGWSLQVLLKEFVDTYRQLCTDDDVNHDELPIQYLDYASWQEANYDSYEKALSYWVDHLDGAPALSSIPTDRPRPVHQDYSGDSVKIEIASESSKRVNQLCVELGITPFVFYFSVFSIVLSRWNNEADVVIGTPTANRSDALLGELIGYFANTLALRVNVNSQLTFREFALANRSVVLGALDHQHAPFEMVVDHLQPERGLSFSPVFQILFAYRNQDKVDVQLQGLDVTELTAPVKTVRNELDLSIVEGSDGVFLDWRFATSLFLKSTIESVALNFTVLLEDIIENVDRPLPSYQMLAEPDLEQLVRWSKGPGQSTEDVTATPSSIVEAIDRVTQTRSDETALWCAGRSLSFGELHSQSRHFAQCLVRDGRTRGEFIGVCMNRSIDMVTAMLGIMRAGCAYVPMDPAYPRSRLDMIAQDSEATLVVNDVLFNEYMARDPLGAEVNLPDLAHEDIAYTIYTSGSTGVPKGVPISHGNVVNFLHAMESEFFTEDSGAWLAITSISFDISVLEIFGSLYNGYKVVLYQDELANAYTHERKEVDFSLFYFADSGQLNNQEMYRLLIEGAKYADQNGFTAIWSPERHFASFGGIYPNPALTAAALSSVTKAISLRAGSCVMPLNNPINVAEQWSVVDNMSDGRAGISFASGWHPDDFVLAPEQFSRRFDAMYDGIEMFNQLWAGEELQGVNGVGKEISVKLFPQPVQKKIPQWLTIAGNPEVFRIAGKLGLNVLTHLLQQSHGELKKNIHAYHEAWREAGHPGEGAVTVMIHTFVASNDAYALDVVADPFKRYLNSALRLLEKNSDAGGVPLDEDEVLNAAFERYSKSSALFGDRQHCTEKALELVDLGVTEIACLIDFGVDADLVLEGLPLIKDVMEAVKVQRVERSNAQDMKHDSVAELISTHRISHLQCTPSFAQGYLDSDATGQDVSHLKHILIGGEEFPLDLIGNLNSLYSSKIYNMYGPTEATVWATYAEMNEGQETVDIGRPLSGYRCYVLDSSKNLCPVGAKGELFIGGASVSSGYHNRPELNADKFHDDPFTANGKMYATGDIARWKKTGCIEFIGRSDQQVKLRGHRIELGEIECCLNGLSEIGASAVIVDSTHAVDDVLVGFVEPADSDPELDRFGLKTRVQEHLVGKLPAYMIPSIVLVLDSMPRTSNGKIDRNALRQLDVIADSAEHIDPSSETEKLLTEIWSELLVVDAGKISMNASFFELGGHSLLLVRLKSMLIEKLGIEVSILELFENATIAKQALLVDGLVKDVGDLSTYARATDTNAEFAEEVVLPI